MTTTNQLVRNARVSKKTTKVNKLALKLTRNSKNGKVFLSKKKPYAKGIIKKVMVKKPRKPNSANRPCAQIVLKNKKVITVYIPGEKHNLQEYSSVLIGGGGAQDLGLKYSIIRGCYDTKGVEQRKQGRSLYGTKKVK